MNAELAPGTLIAGRYRLERLLGKGGMGQVWAVTHEVTHRSAALKLLNGPVHLRADRRRRFLREARAASAVKHPNVVVVHDFFELEDGTPVMLMDLLEGETLGRRLSRQGSLSLDEAADILVPVVSAVGTAHARGVIHRDLKPDNVFLARTEAGALDVRVLDFGVAKLTHAGAQGPDESDALTRTGGFLGTPCYMSPEQSFGEGSIDHRTDIWSLGVLFYETLAGSRPIDGANVGQVLKRLVSEAITPIEVLLPDLPAEVAALIGRMLQRDPSERPQDLREVHAVLGRFSSVKAPEFAAAIGEAPPPLDSRPLSDQRPAPSGTRASPDADRTPTSPTASSTLVAVPTFSSAVDTGPPPSRRRRWTYLGLSMGLVSVAIAGRIVFGAGAVERAPVAPTPPPAVTTTPSEPVAPAPSSAASSEHATTAPETVPAPNEAAPGAVNRRKNTVRAAAARPKTPSAAPTGSRRGGLVDEPPF